MKVFILTPWFRPAYKAGGPIQSLANMLSELEDEYEFRIVCSNYDLDGTANGTKNGRWVLFRENAKIWYTEKGMTRKLLKEMSSEVVFINGIYSWNYTLKPILFSKAKRKIVSVRGMLHPGALSQKRLKKKLYIHLWKWLRIHTKVEFHASTEEEKSFIKEIFGPNVIIHVAANFPRVFARQEVGQKEKGKLDLVSVALISPMKNILLVLQALQKTTANINYHIYGPVKDANYWRQCENLIKALPPNVNVYYQCDITPLQVERALNTGHVFIQPSKAENFGHSIYEALTAGKPVITSHHTPWNGLAEAKAGINVSVETEKQLTAAIDSFAAMDASELETWSKGARSYAENAINFEVIRQQYRSMFGAGILAPSSLIKQMQNTAK